MVAIRSRVSLAGRGAGVLEHPASGEPRARQDGVLLAVRIGTIFLLHTVVNAGMMRGIMPVSGISLPFICHGRSSLVASLISLGILQSIAARSSAEET